MPEAQQEGGQSILRTGLQSVGLFLLVQFAIKQFIPQPKTGVTPAANGTATVAAPTSIPAFSERAEFDEDLLKKYAHVPQRIAPIWSTNTSLDIYGFVSPSFNPPVVSKPAPAIPVIQERDFTYGTFQEAREVHTTFAVPPQVQDNGTLWAHFFIGKSGHELDPSRSGYDSSSAYHFSRPLNQYLKRKKVAKVRNLLSKDAEDEEQEPEEELPTLASYYHPNYTLSFIPDSGVLSYQQMHPGVREWVQLERTGARDASGQNGWYYPIFFVNTFWQLREYMTELNSTIPTTELPLNVHLNELGNWKFNILASMEFGFKQQKEKAARGESIPGGGDGSEIEMLKQILLDSNLYLLATTVIVGILHTVFEMLAFKNDVSHWRKKKDNVGVSVRTILANVFMQSVIFLYLLDNNENTSWMILFGQGMGIAIEAWKITKSVDVRIRATNAQTTGLWRYLPYEIKFEDKHKLSDTEKETEEYDQIAFKYMGYIAVPLLLAYAAYSLLYESHKSWYSFVITTLVGSVYGNSNSPILVLSSSETSS